MDKINVNLYGGKSIFGGKEKPLEAIITYCDICDKCTLYKQGKCLQIISVLSGNDCKFGKNEYIKGYTSRAKKYYDFKRKYENDEKYNNLCYPHKTKIAYIDDYVYLNLTYVMIDFEGTTYKITESGFRNCNKFIHKNYFTVDLLNRILSFRPHALIGGEITTYKKEIVPEILRQLKLLDNDLYNNLISKYPQYNITFSYIGKKAYLNTINNGIVKYRSENYPQFNEDWYWDGEYLTYSKGYVHKPNICDKFDEIEIKIKPNKDCMITIHDNSQVNENTIFES